MGNDTVKRASPGLESDPFVVFEDGIFKARAESASGKAVAVQARNSAVLLFRVFSGTPNSFRLGTRRRISFNPLVQMFDCYQDVLLPIGGNRERPIMKILTTWNGLSGAACCKETKG